MNRVRSLLSIRSMLLGYSFEPRSNRRALATVGSVMTIGLSKNGCSHSKKPVWREKTTLTSPDVWAAATSKVWHKASFSPTHPRRQQEALLADSLCTEPPHPSPQEKGGAPSPIFPEGWGGGRCTHARMKTTLWVCIGQLVRLRVRVVQFFKQGPAYKKRRTGS